jgi:4'-phosphopantetheinyl transferase
MTKVYIASLSSYSAEKINSLYESIRDNFSGDGRISQRKESLMGRIMLHNALTELGAGEYTVRYIADEKPSLICRKDLYFNISHSDDFVAVTVSDNEVGCDIQEIRPYNPKVAVRHYCKNETRLIENSEDKDGVFIRLWALKESILKFKGKGISGGLSSYDFSPYIADESFGAFDCSFYVNKIENTYFALCHKNAEFIIEKTAL